MQFCEKLDYLIQVSGVSNSKLSKKMNVDASLISKWRHGVRHPRKRSYLIQICEAIAPGFDNEYLKGELSEISGIPTEKLHSHKQVASALMEWLCVSDSPMSRTTPPPSPNAQAGIFYGENLSGRNKNHELVLQEIAERIMKAGRIPCLRIFIDAPFTWMQAFSDRLFLLAKLYPDFFSRFDRVSLLLSGTNKNEQEFRCGWEIMDHFSDFCEVSVTMTDERYAGVFQHSILIAEDVTACTSFGFYDSESAFTLIHTELEDIRKLTRDYDALSARSQVIIREYPNYTAWEEARGFMGMLERDADIYYRSYDIPPALIPSPLVHRLVHRASGSSVTAPEPNEAFCVEVQPFLSKNRLYTTFPVLLPGDISNGVASFPHTDSTIDRTNIVTNDDYLEILRYTLSLYERNENLMVKTVKPGEITYDFLAQEMNRYSHSRIRPRRYTYIATHHSVVANAIKYIRAYFSDTPACPHERAQLAAELQTAIQQFEAETRR